MPPIPTSVVFVILGLGCETNQIDGLLDDDRVDQSTASGTMVSRTRVAEATLEAGFGSPRRARRRGCDRSTTTAPARHISPSPCSAAGHDGYSRSPPTLPSAGRPTCWSPTAGPRYSARPRDARRRTPPRAAGDRAANVAELLLDRLEWWRWHNEPEDNPSPGNKKGGLTTIAEKSLGAVAKGGSTPLVDVLRYAEPLRRPGFVIMDSPGYDPCSVTGEIASGATSSASPPGAAVCRGSLRRPSLKVSTNSALFER